MAIYRYSSTLLEHMIGGLDVPGWVIDWHADAYRKKPLINPQDRNKVSVLQHGLLDIVRKVKPEGSLATALGEINHLMDPAKEVQPPLEQRQHLNAARWALKAYERECAQKAMIKRLRAEGKIPEEGMGDIG